MTNNELNFDNYSKAYIDFVSKDIMSFVDEFILLTNNIDKNIRYYFVGNGASAAIASHLSNDFFFAKIVSESGKYFSCIISYTVVTLFFLPGRITL